MEAERTLMDLAPDLNTPGPVFSDTNKFKRQNRHIELFSVLNSWTELFVLNPDFLSLSRFSATKRTSISVARPKIMATPTQKIVPKASALFVTFELQLYKHWRQTAFGINDESEDDTLLPTAFEYKDFLEWRARINTTPDAEDKSPNPAFAGFVVADRCGHPLHPGDPRVELQQQEQGKRDEKGEAEDRIAWCPMCVLQIHLKLLDELWDKWKESGGPWRILPPGGTSENFQVGKRAYYKGKTGLVNEVDNLEDIARLEASWEAAHPTADVEVARTYSAKTAVEMYAKSVRFPARLAEVGQIAPKTPARKGGKKRLSYSPDTPEDTRHRSNGLYARNHPSYDPESPYRCPKDDGWAETSFRDSWEYNVRQCRTLLCNKNPSEPNVTYRELTDDTSKDNLINVIEEWFSKMQEEWKADWVNILLTTTDIFVVWRSTPSPDGSDDEFDNWDRVETLVGTNLEAYARRIGDITDEDSGLESSSDALVVEGEEVEDCFEQDSLASDSESDEEHELSDTMGLENDESNIVMDVA